MLAEFICRSRVMEPTMERARELQRIHRFRMPHSPRREYRMRRVTPWHTLRPKQIVLTGLQPLTLSPRKGLLIGEESGCRIRRLWLHRKARV